MYSPIETFDYSMLNLFRTCPRKFEERMLRHLEPKNTPAFVTGFGHAGHEALAIWYQSGGNAELMDKAFIDAWLTYEGQDVKGIRCMARGLTILKQYRERYPIDREPFVIDPKYIEIGFAVELQDYIFCGKMDGAPRWTMGFEGNIVLENKFSGSKGYLTTNPNHQIDGYIWALSQLSGEPAVGAYFNQIYHLGKKLDGNEFVRELTRRTKEDLDEWELDTICWMGKVNQCIKEARFPKNTNSCGAFYRACEYTILCTCRDPVQREVLRETCYDKIPWNPYPGARDGKKGEKDE